MSDINESGDTQLVLPIVCAHCGHENELSMLFALLPPKKIEEPIIKNIIEDHDLPKESEAE